MLTSQINVDPVDAPLAGSIDSIDGQLQNIDPFVCRDVFQLEKVTVVGLSQPAGHGECVDVTLVKFLREQKILREGR